MPPDERGIRKVGWHWHEGPVDVSGEHIELRYGDASASCYEDWMPVALIGKPTESKFPVQWLSRPAVSAEMISAAQRELDFFLVEHPREQPAIGDPWNYAIYHCSTAANVYSSVHWSYYRFGQQG